MERTPAGIRPIFSSALSGPTNSQRQLLGRFLHGSARVLRGFAGGSSGIASSSSGVASGGSGVASGGGSGVNGSVASGGGSVRRSSGGVRGGVSSLASGSGGVSSSFLRGFDGFFLLGAASEGQGGEGGGECDLRVHWISTPKFCSLLMSNTLHLQLADPAAGLLDARKAF